jgi:hypothetical protein
MLEEIMVAALKILALPSLFILPWLWMKVSNAEPFVQKMLTNQPLLVGALLLPGIILSIVWIANQFKR